MSNLLASFSVAGNALDVYQRALSVIQNNIANASTPGYSRQQLTINPLPMQIHDRLIGGISAGRVQSSSNAYANNDVQVQMQLLGRYKAQAQGAEAVQQLLDISGKSGVTGTLTALFNSFSAWSVSPNDPASKQTVISAAGSFASAMRGLTNSLKSTAQQFDSQVATTVAQVNQLAAQVQQYNIQRQRHPEPDPAEEANLRNSLEGLSDLVNFSTVTQNDGSVTVLVGGSDPLVIGTQLHPLSSNVSVDTDPTPANPAGPPTQHILDADGHDITGEISGGQLGGMLDVRNRVLGSILGDSQQQGSLNVLASSLADTINQILTSGTVSTVAGAAKGSALFTYDSSDATKAAGSLTVNSSVTPDQLAPVDVSGKGNGNPNALAALADATSGPGTIGGLNFTAYFGQMAAAAGAENKTASDYASVQSSVTQQAQALRDKISGVSLDQEAVSIMQFQKAYEASAKVLTVLNDLAGTTLGLIPGQ